MHWSELYGNVYLICAFVGAYLAMGRGVLAFFGWGGTDQHGGHGLHLVHSALVPLTLPLVGLTVFGLVGFSTARMWPEPLPFLLGMAFGIGIIVPLQILETLFARKSIDLQQTVGRTATVTQTVPANQSGAGHISVTVWKRVVDVPAVTRGDELLAGVEVVVRKVFDTHTVEVELPVDFAQIWCQALPPK